MMIFQYSYSNNGNIFGEAAPQGRDIPMKSFRYVLKFYQYILIISPKYIHLKYHLYIVFRFRAPKSDLLQE